MPVAEFTVAPIHQSYPGIVHGGVVASILDEAGGRTAAIDEGCDIGAGTKIWHFCHVMGGAQIGEGCNIGQNVFVAGNVIIGSLRKDYFTLSNSYSFGEPQVQIRFLSPRALSTRPTGTQYLWFFSHSSGQAAFSRL